MELITTDFNQLYKNLCKRLLNCPSFSVTNKDGQKLHEDLNVTICLKDLDKPYAFCRNLNMYYLIGELLFYYKGENKLKNISNYSSFWNKCSDDGVNLNSCYGYYIFKQLTPSKISQFDYCYEQLINNKESKKAVVTIYSAKLHSKKTKDNPCTMFLQFFIRNNKLHLKTQMRSNDLWYGLSYDLPFFVFIQKMMFYKLKEFYTKLELGEYVHTSNSLHIYERNFKNIEKILDNPYSEIEVPKIKKSTFDNFDKLLKIENDLSNIDMKDDFLNYCKNILTNFKHINFIKQVANEMSTCLKKKVACVFVKDNVYLEHGWSGRPEKQGICKKCYRKDLDEEFFTDQCNSLHSEERAIIRISKKNKLKELEGSTCYLTHAPCDQCMKFLIEVGCKKVVYQYSYKTHFERYKNIIKIEDVYGRIII